MKTNRLSAASPGFCAAVLLMAFCAAAVGAATDDPLSADLPTTRLFDTGAPLTDQLTARPSAGSWQLVAEGAPHAFGGDAVALNDQVVLVVHRGADGVQLYSRGAAGMKPRAVLSPAVKGDAGAVSAVGVAENSASAVALAVTFERGASLTFRITTGDVKVEVRGPAGLAVRSQARWAVVPDFFANDMVFGPDDLGGERVYLPAENFFLALLDGSDCMLMTVWDEPGRDAALLASPASEGHAIVGWNVAGSESGHAWVGVLDGPGIWYGGAAPGGAGATAALDWTPPFPAKWRADLLGSDPLVRSLSLRQGTDDEEEDLTAACPCTVADGRTTLDLPTAGRVVVYPIDRSRTTPLNAFCPIDVVRSALGVGPCQYILAMEGMNRETLPTPADVTHWVERQFERGRDTRQAEAIRQQLDRMVDHVAHAQKRIGLYKEFADEVRAACAAQATGPAAHAAELLGRTAEEMERSVGAAEGSAASENARRLADGIVALIGQAGAADQCAKLGVELRALGAVQDRALAGARMAVRWLRQQCRMVAADDPAGAGLAAQFQARAEAMLRQQ